MPSLSSNHSYSNKKQSKLSSSSIPNAAATPPCTTAAEPQHFASLCQQASRIFPSFISQSAFVAEITDIESLSEGAAKIWLSESSMLASSLAPGSLVSVSIPSSSKAIAQLPSFPLTSLTAECDKCYGLETCKALGDAAAGNYFAIATVFPARKVLKNGVHLSSNISFAMGRPPLGTCVFVHPLQKQSLVYNCKELYLQLAPCKIGPPLKVNNFPSLDLSKSKSHAQSENDIVASPKTPSYGSKFSNESVYSSPLYEDSASSATNYNEQLVTSFDISKTLGNESSKKLLEKYATALLLSSRCLLIGNLVSCPMLSEFFIFQVMDIKKVSASIPCPLYGSNNPNLEDSDTVEKVKVAFNVNSETKIFIDELHAIAASRRLVVTLLSLMDGITGNEGLLVIAATNKLDHIDPDLRRFGRFDQEIEFEERTMPEWFPNFVL